MLIEALLHAIVLCAVVSVWPRAMRIASGMAWNFRRGWNTAMKRRAFDRRYPPC